MKCLLPSLDPFTVFPVLLNLEVNTLERSLPELLLKKTQLLKCLYFPCSLCLKMYSFWVPCELFTCVSCYCKVALNTSCFSQICWRAAVFALPFVYCSSVVWRDVGKIDLPPSSPFLCIHSQTSQLGIFRTQQELFHLCSALVLPVFSPLPLQDSILASLSCSKLRFCCGSLNLELLAASIQSGDPWLGNVVVMRWWLLSNGKWETTRL